MLDDKIAIVTGGSTGIGRATAEKYLEYGADVVIANRSTETGRTTAEELGCDFVQCDVAEYEHLKALVETTVEDYGRLDVMVNNAGIGRVGSVEDMSLEDWHDVMRINLNGVMHGTRAAVPHLKESEEVSSISRRSTASSPGRQQPPMRRPKAGSSTSHDLLPSITPSRTCESTVSALGSSTHR